MQSKKIKLADSALLETAVSTNVLKGSVSIVQLDSNNVNKASKDKELLSAHLKLDTPFFKEYCSQYRNRQAGKIYHSSSVEDKGNVYSQIITEPFLAGTIGEVFDDKFLRKVKSEIEIGMTYTKKCNDLYEFFQSTDLKVTKLKHLKRLRDTIYSEDFITLLSKLTGVQLSSTVDVSVSKYVYGNHLLCHSDDIHTSEEGRRIAFILYLVDETWSELDGGALELFSSTQLGHPSHLNKHSILPKWNQMAFFEIGQHSYHQVAEVIAKCKDRLSVVGWFHGPHSHPAILEFPVESFSHLEAALSFINTDYMSSATQSILANFKEKGCVELHNFIRPEIYPSLFNELEKVDWGSSKGPAHVRKYCIADTYPKTIQCLFNELKSFLFKRFLANITGMDFTHWRGELQRFEPRDYSLLNDEVLEPKGLDFLLYLTSPDAPSWGPAWGGGLHYLQGEDTLCTIYPKPNCLFLINRSEGNLRFTKYVKSQAKYPIYVISFVYS